MNKQRRLNLMALEGSLIGVDGNSRCFLEIGVLENGDIYVNMSGQDKNKELHYVSAQIPNPVNGGGRLEDYHILSRFYEIIGKTIHYQTKK
ncbi:MAG: hypothetical protein AABY15_08175 [Nanoarchaeota archaeon]